MILFFILLTSFTYSCSVEQDIIDICVEEKDKCSACFESSDCVIVSNPCHEYAYCAHKDSEVMVNSIGCNFEYDVPKDSSCKCINNICKSNK